jgi:hypothetical protein
VKNGRSLQCQTILTYMKNRCKLKGRKSKQRVPNETEYSTQCFYEELMVIDKQTVTFNKRFGC